MYACRRRAFVPAAVLRCKLGFVYPTVGAIHESPVVSAPSERGLSNAQHLTGGEIFSFLSLRLLPAAKATSLPEGGTTGRRGRRPLRTKRNAFTPTNPRLSFYMRCRNKTSPRRPRTVCGVFLCNLMRLCGMCFRPFPTRWRFQSRGQRKDFPQSNSTM